MRPNSLLTFWERVNKTDSCWLWTGSRTKKYGSFSIGGRTHFAHRFSYTLKFQIPDGMELDHLCREPLCVRPSHLEPVTHKENVRRGSAPTAINSRKTHCKNGHQFTPENTYQRRDGRECWACKRDRRGSNNIEDTAEYREPWL